MAYKFGSTGGGGDAVEGFETVAQSFGVGGWGDIVDGNETTNNSNGVIAEGCGSLEIATNGGTTGDFFSLSNKLSGVTAAGANPDTDNEDFVWMITASLYIAFVDSIAFIGIAQDSLVSSGVPSKTTTDNHIGFFLDNTGNVIASNADGSTQTTTDTGVTGGGESQVFRIENDSGAGEYKFYIDSTLVATHSTNRPSMTINTADACFAVEAEDASSVALKLSRNLFWMIDMTF